MIGERSAEIGIPSAVCDIAFANFVKYVPYVIGWISMRIGAVDQPPSHVQEKKMRNMGKKLGAQSYCFRGFATNEKVIDCLRKCGLTSVELCGVHADLSDVSGFAKVVDLYDAAGISIVSIGVQSFCGDRQLEEKYFKCAQLAGAGHISVNFCVDRMTRAFRTAERLADKYDILLGIHNHGGHHWLGSRQMLRHVFANTSERIGLCLDTAWALAAREDPLEMAGEFASRLYGLHLKDFVFDRSGKPKDVVVGAGNIDLGCIVKVCRRAKNLRMAVLEYEGEVNNPVPAMKKCVAAFRKAVKK